MKCKFQIGDELIVTTEYANIHLYETTAVVISNYHGIIYTQDFSVLITKVYDPTLVKGKVVNSTVSAIPVDEMVILELEYSYGT